MAHALGVGFGVVVVAGEETRTGRVDQLADRFVGIRQCAVGVEPRDRALGDGVAVVDRHPVHPFADRALRRAGLADHHHGVLGGAEAVLDLDTEAARELLDVLVVGLVAEGDAQRVVGIVVAFRGGQDVGERLADVVHVGRAVVSDIIEEVARREPGRHDRGAGNHRGCPPGDDRVGVEQGHGHVAGVPLGQGEALRQVEAGEGGHQVGNLHCLRVAARAGREDHHERVHRGDLPMGHEFAGLLDELGPLRRRGVEDPGFLQVQAVEQGQVFGVGDQELAVRAPDVGGERLASPRGVQAAQHVAAEPGRRHLGQHLGVVSQQGAHVHRPARVGSGDQGRRPRRRPGQVPTPTPLQPKVFDGEPGIGQALAQQRLNRVVSHRSDSPSLCMATARRDGPSYGSGGPKAVTPRQSVGAAHARDPKPSRPHAVQHFIAISPRIPDRRLRV